MARILIAVRPSKGGAFGHAVRLAQALAADHDVALCGPHGEQRDGLGVELLEVDIPREISPAGHSRSVLEFVRAQRRFEPDLVHAHGSQAGAVSRLARSVAPRTPLVFSPHNFAFTNWFTSKRQRSAYVAIERMLVPMTSRYVAVCEAELRQVARIGASRRGRLVYNGIEPFDPPDPDPGAAALAASGPLLLAVTELQPPKGIPTLIEAMPLVLAARPEANLMIAGDGPMEDEIAAMVARLGLDDRVHLLGAVRNVPALLAAATVFVAPGWAESFPYANLEAMSASLPIVAADSGGVGEAIVDGRTGRLVPGHDASALAAATLELIEDPDRAARLGAAARNMLEERFTFRGMIEGTRAVYAELGVA